jgi:phage gpG-like protein
MKEFSIEGFVAHLAGMTVAVDAAETKCLERAGQIVEKEAKREIGAYQDAAEPFAPWAELAQSTKDDRVRQGYSENEPLLRTGELRDSIEHCVVGHEAHVGSDSEIAVYQELGTAHIPPRSFLGGALVRKTDDVVDILGESLVTALVGDDVFAGRLQLRGDED